MQRPGENAERFEPSKVRRMELADKYIKAYQSDAAD